MSERRLLVVDDDQDLVSIIREEMEAQGYEVITFGDGPASLRHVQMWGLPHLALIDLGLPSMHGFELSDQLKKLGDVPIVFITANEELDTVLKGLNSYAEDYLVKPFDVRELSARIGRVLKRLPGFDYAQPPAIRVDDWLSVDFGRGRLVLGDRDIALTPTEAKLLHILMRHAGQVVHAQTLIDRAWPDEEAYEDRLRVHMHRLRRKVEPDPHHPRYIQTERGSGYRFIPTDIIRPR